MPKDRYPCGYPTNAEIALLWSAGKNTNEIAKTLWSPEYEIANRLPLILRTLKQDQEWNFDRTA